MKTIHTASIIIFLVAIVAAQNVGDPAPNFTLQTLEHGEVSLANLAGKVVYLNFIGYNWPFCIAAGPATESNVYQIYKNENFQALALDVYNGNASQVNSFKSQTGISYPICLNASGTALSYGVHREWMIIIDQQGIIRYKKLKPDINEVVSTIDQLLTATGLEDSPVTPEQFILEQNYPNPFNPITSIKFSIPRSEFVELSIINSVGQKISTLVNKRLGAGVHEVKWEALNVSSGIYFYRLTAGEFQARKKMILLKWELIDINRFSKPVTNQ